MLHIYDEDHSKEYDLPFPGSKKVLDVKTDMYECSDIPVSQQVWSGWPEGCINDNMTLNQLELNLPVHELSFRSAAVSNHRAERKKRSSRVSISAVVKPSIGSWLPNICLTFLILCTDFDARIGQ